MPSDAILPLLGDASLVYVDCGARAGSAPSWLRPATTAQYAGIDADAAECERLNVRGRNRHQYIPAVLGRAAETRTLYVTRNPACSSLLRPNSRLLAPFAELREFFDIEREVSVTTTTLDTCLASHGILSTDFIELDTQGSELDVLIGAERVLRESVLGLQVEVEFAEMYEQQPLFGDIDHFLRRHGFQLFDLARYHVRRGPLASTVQTRGQLLWGQALYLRSADACASPAMLRRLAGVAALAGVADLTLDILASLSAANGSDAFSEIVERARKELGQSGTLRVWRD
jgi:FkbM family methyltransferase